MGVSKLFKQFSKMTEEEKADFMELISNDEEEVKEDKEVEQVVEETQNPKAETKVKAQPKEEKKDSEVVEKTDDTIVEQPKVEAQAQVEEVEKFDGISLNDVVLKDDFKAQIDALNAKLESIVKENKDLKDKLNDAEGKAKDLHDKYERDDFGSQVDKNYGEKDFGKSYESADDYLKKFM